MTLEPPKITRLKIYPEKIAQAAIDRVEILTGTIRCDVTGAAIEILRFRRVERCLKWRRVHVGPCSPSRLAS
jgi:hypothetical protein